jgi:hypothetical protein
MSDRLQRRLVLHFDVNETIMVGDPAGGDTFEDCLNKIIAKNAFVPKDDPLAVDGGDGTTPVLHTLWDWPEGMVPFYEMHRPVAKVFTEDGKAGSSFRPLYEQQEQALRWPTDEVGAAPPALSHDGVHHFLLPAFFHTICELNKQGREFTVVIRTFGSDLSDVAAAMSAFARGEHPCFPAAAPVGLSPEATWIGRYSTDGAFFITNEATGEAVADEAAVLEVLQGGRATGAVRAVGCQDDYHWWKDHGYAPGGGKPLWVTEGGGEAHHIFFDDNIHNDCDDSIVAVRSRADAASAFAPLTGAETVQQHGVHTVRVPTLAPILDIGWFLARIEECEAAAALALALA